jgi:hypothetical protein
MLFMQPLFTARLPESLPRAGYADDSKLAARGKSLESNCSILAADFADAAQWCTVNQIPLDHNKTALMHFTRSTRAGNPPIRLASQSPAKILHPVATDGNLKWLGVLFDQRLSFCQHSQAAAAKGKRAASALKLLGGCKRGAPAHLLRQAVMAVVIPILSYASETWCIPPSTMRRLTKPRVSQLDRTLCMALRHSLPVYHTTPNHFLHNYASAPPMSLILDNVSRKAAVRLARIDSYHPLHYWVQHLRASNSSHLASIARLLPAQIASTNPFLFPLCQHE